MVMKKYGNLKKTQRVYLFFKRGIDIFGSSLGIILFSPIMLLCALIIKCTSKGPVFFRQERLGRYKKVFKIFKFRSMRADAPEVAPSDMTEEQQEKMTYKWGEFMRKTSLDELPQLFNIFLGHMTFIGPRPGAAHNEEELIVAREKYTPNAYDVKPGLSGYAQTRMKRDHDPEQKAFYDNYYVVRMNFWFDLKIFIYTITTVFGITKGR